MATSPRRHDDILGSTVTQDDIELPGYYLPRKIQVLRSYLAGLVVQRVAGQRQDSRKAEVDVAKRLVECYEKAHIPALHEETLIYHVQRLYKGYRDIKRVKKTNKTRETKLETWRSGMEELFPAWGDTSKLLEEDARFLEDQRSLQFKMMMGPKDQKLDHQLKRKSERMVQEQSRQVRESRRVAEDEVVQMPSGSSEESGVSQDEGGASQDEEILSELQPPSPARSHKRSKKMTQSLEIAPDILRHPHVAQTMIRNNITPTAALATIQAICTAAGGDPSKLNLSYGSVYR